MQRELEIVAVGTQIKEDIKQLKRDNNITYFNQDYIIVKLGL